MPVRLWFVERKNSGIKNFPEVSRTEKEPVSDLMYPP